MAVQSKSPKKLTWMDVRGSYSIKLKEEPETTINQRLLGNKLTPEDVPIVCQAWDTFISPVPRRYICSKCGKIESWNSNWESWCSIEDIEERCFSYLNTCSKKCRRKLTVAIKNAIVRRRRREHGDYCDKTRIVAGVGSKQSFNRIASAR